MLCLKLQFLTSHRKHEAVFHLEKTKQTTTKKNKCPILLVEKRMTDEKSRITMHRMAQHNGAVLQQSDTSRSMWQGTADVPSRRTATTLLQGTKHPGANSGSP